MRAAFMRLGKSGLFAIQETTADKMSAAEATAASGGNREPLLEPRPARCERQRSRCWVPQPVLVSEEKATGLLAPHKLFANAWAVQKAICRL